MENGHHGHQLDAAALANLEMLMELNYKQEHALTLPQQIMALTALE